MKTSSTKNSLIIGISIVLGASLLSVGVSNAASTTIKACAKKSGGAMRLIDTSKKCNSSERTLSWSIKGSTGAKGATGGTGATGANGSPGATGASGTNGASFATYTRDPGIGELSTSPSPQTIASLSGLTSGNYLLNATMEVSNIDLLGLVDCRFRIPVGSNSSYSSPLIRTLFLTDADIQDQITANYIVEDLPGGAYDTVIFECYVNGTSGQKVNFQEIYMSASKVDTMVRQ
jgi:hypothetical protein